MRRLSKITTLRLAIRYIKALQKTVAASDNQGADDKLRSPTELLGGGIGDITPRASTDLGEFAPPPDVPRTEGTRCLHTSYDVHDMGTYVPYAPVVDTYSSGGDNRQPFDCYSTDFMR